MLISYLRFELDILSSHLPELSILSPYLPAEELGLDQYGEAFEAERVTIGNLPKLNDAAGA